jgi:hypothetical protein
MNRIAASTVSAHFTKNEENFPERPFFANAKPGMIHPQAAALKSPRSQEAGDLPQI